MKPWVERPREEAHLLNPAFCSVTIAAACAGYSEPHSESLPFVLSFLVLPVVLHKSTRESLPRTSRTSIPAWLQEHPEARIGFHERLMALRPFTREALRYGLASDWFCVGDLGGIRCVAPDASLTGAIRIGGEVSDCVSRARFLGKWFAIAASTETTLALWGIRP